MGDIEVGGDSSVTWNVNADNVRRAPANPAVGVPPQSNPAGSGGVGHHQKGIDEITGGWFKVIIKLPATLVSTTASAVTYSVPIQSNVTDQVRIEWSTNPPQSVLRARRTRAGAKKATAKKKAKRK